MSLIVNYWPQHFRGLYGGSWPTSYCAVDVETSGWQFDRDVITEWGHCLVEDGEVTDQLSLVIDWTDHHVVPDNWLRTRLRAVSQGMELNGARCHMSYDRMKAEGMKPDKALAFISNFLAAIRKRMIFAAHGGLFDEKMLCANLKGFVPGHPGFSFGDNGLLDTEGIEKASQCVDNTRMHPAAKDTLRSYFHRVRYARVEGIKSNMDSHCYAKYQFLEKHKIEKCQLHSAVQDAYCVHLLMEAFREQLTPAPILPPIFPTADHKAERQGKTVAVKKALPFTPGKRIRGQLNR